MPADTEDDSLAIDMAALKKSAMLSFRVPFFQRAGLQLVAPESSGKQQ